MAHIMRIDEVLSRYSKTPVIDTIQTLHTIGEPLARFQLKQELGDDFLDNPDEIMQKLMNEIFAFSKMKGKMTALQFCEILDFITLAIPSEYEEKVEEFFNTAIGNHCVDTEGILSEKFYFDTLMKFSKKFLQ